MEMSWRRVLIKVRRRLGFGGVERETSFDGKVGVEEMVVDKLDAADVQSRLFPSVFATARMISLMEKACARSMMGMLDNGEVSVGCGVAVVHEAAVAVGAEVRATSTVVGVREKMYTFEVVVEDDSGVLGRGRHSRYIVNRDRFEDGARRRIGGGQIGKRRGGRVGCPCSKCFKGC